VEIMLMDAAGETAESFEAIMRAVWQLRDLARNTLRFSRQQSTQVRLFDLDELVGQVREFLAPMIKMVRLETTLADGLPQVMADPSQIEQVLTNFLINALDAMGRQSDAWLRIATGVERPAERIAREEEAGRVIRMALDAEPAFLQTSAVYVEVRDNGPGIGADAMDEIFEAFFTTKEEDKGTGLGLAISRTIAAAHQGNILVASAPGTGACFSLVLPLPTKS